MSVAEDQMHWLFMTQTGVCRLLFSPGTRNSGFDWHPIRKQIWGPHSQTVCVHLFAGEDMISSLQFLLINLFKTLSLALAGWLSG